MYAGEEGILCDNGGVYSFPEFVDDRNDAARGRIEGCSDVLQWQGLDPQLAVGEKI